jgi:hypothetical protein
MRSRNTDIYRSRCHWYSSCERRSLSSNVGNVWGFICCITPERSIRRVSLQVVYASHRNIVLSLEEIGDNPVSFCLILHLLLCISPRISSTVTAFAAVPSVSRGLYWWISVVLFHVTPVINVPHAIFLWLRFISLFLLIAVCLQRWAKSACVATTCRFIFLSAKISNQAD